jgi:Icc-related predicted phosphoesterase
VYTHSTMYIKLTNATPAHKGTPLAIRKDLVVSVHHNTVTREDGSVEQVTFLHCPPHGTWEAEDSFDSVVAQLNGEQQPAEQPGSSRAKKLPRS